MTNVSLIRLKTLLQKRVEAEQKSNPAEDPKTLSDGHMPKSLEGFCFAEISLMAQDGSLSADELAWFRKKRGWIERGRAKLWG